MYEAEQVAGINATDIERALARSLVIAGGGFWAIAAFAGPSVGTTLQASLQTAAWPFAATAVIATVGWKYERLASVLLFAATAAVIVWGTLYAWESGVWLLMTILLIVPMLAAGVLFLLAAHSETRLP